MACPNLVTRVRQVKLGRRWVFTIAAVLVAVVAVGYNMFNRPPEECGPVQEMFEFNRSQAALIEETAGAADGPPRLEDEAAYQRWADGLAERAQRVSRSRPDLARNSEQVANLANEFVGKLATLRAQTEARSPDGPPPQALFELVVINDQITRKLAELAEVCSG